MTAAKPVPRGQGRAAACVSSTKGRQNGFTLIELIIALALVALITVLLFSGLRLGSRAWDGVDTVAERNAELRSARGFLDRTLSQARDLVLRYDAQDHQVFAGDATSLEFVAPLSEHVGIPGLYVLRLGLEGDGKDLNLVLTRWLLHPDVLSGGADAPEWQPLDPGSPGISAVAVWSMMSGPPAEGTARRPTPPRDPSSARSEATALAQGDTQTGSV